MDLNALLRLVFLDKNDLTFGVLTGLLLLTLIALLVRSVMQEKSESDSGSTHGSSDKRAMNEVIEVALKKAISENAVAVSATVGAQGEVSIEAKELQKTLSEREAKIAALMSDLEVVKSQMEKSAGGAGAAGSSGGSGGGGGSGEDVSGLHAKIKELQTKLAEYEIIEDDIADLSIFKEENKKLKEEVDKLRAAVETAKTQVQTAQAATNPAPLVDNVQAAQAAVVSAAETKTEAPAAKAAAAPPRPAPEAFKLDTNDDVMGEFAQALAGESNKPQLESSLVSGSGAEVADPKAAIDKLFSAPAAEEPNDPFGELDTEKMLAEVASLKEATAGTDSSSVLDEQLDTDRLMAEMGMGEMPVAAEKSPEAPAIAPAVAPTPAVAPVPPAAVPHVPRSTPVAEIAENEVPVDDLLAEFKDTELLKGTKGS